MTGNGKTDKKFHTLQHQISVVFICLLLLSIFTITLINGLFLEKYYVSKKVEVLEEAKEVLSQMNLDDILQYDTDIEEDKKGATDEISDEIERSSSRNNLTWIIVNEENSGYYYWGENNMAKMLRSKLFGYINNLDQDMQQYVPNTVVKEDIRELTAKTLRVIAVYRKDLTAPIYEELTYKAKKIDFSTIDFPERFGYLKLQTT